VLQNFTCAFSNAIMSSRASCEFSAKNCLAEKEFGACNSESSSKKCSALYDYLRANSGFAIGGILQNNLTVAQQNKIRIGGIKALNNLVFGSEKVENINDLVAKLLTKYQQVENIPMQDIIPQIAKFKIRNT
jgi:hypothetical protein